MGSIEPKDNRKCFAWKSYLTMLTEPVKLCQPDVTLTLVKLNKTVKMATAYVWWNKYIWMISLCWPWPILTLLRRSGECFRTFRFSIFEIGTVVMALYLHQNFVSAQYLENQTIEFQQIIYMHSSCQDLAWDYNIFFFAHLYQSYGPWFTLKFRFRSISWELTDIFSPHFINAFILRRSNLGMLHVIYRKFVPELWPFIYDKSLFPFISWEPIV